MHRCAQVNAGTHRHHCSSHFPLSSSAFFSGKHSGGPEGDFLPSTPPPKWIGLPGSFPPPFPDTPVSSLDMCLVVLAPCPPPILSSPLTSSFPLHPPCHDGAVSSSPVTSALQNPKVTSLPPSFFGPPSSTYQGWPSPLSGMFSSPAAGYLPHCSFFYRSHPFSSSPRSWNVPELPRPALLCLHHLLGPLTWAHSFT